MFKKLRHGFVDEKAMITTTWISSCLWETLVPFCLWKKQCENAFIIVNSQNRTEKQIMPFKTT